MQRWVILIQWVIAAFALLWALFVIAVFFVRMPHNEITNNASTAVHSADTQSLNHALDDYEALSKWAGCYDDIHRTRAQLHMLSADRSLVRNDFKQSENHLQQAQQAIKAQLSCRPRDGKSWLDYMLILTEREGFSDGALQAFKHSSYAAPREAWLAEKRILFALIFLPLLDTEALEIAQTDSASLKESLGGRHLKFLAKSQLKSLDELDVILNEAINQKKK